MGKVKKEIEGGVIIGGVMKVWGKWWRGVEVRWVLKVSGKCKEGWELGGVGNVSVEKKGVERGLVK